MLCSCLASTLGWLESRGSQSSASREPPLSLPALGPHLVWAAGDHVRACGDQLPREGEVTPRAGRHCTVNVWGLKGWGRELRWGADKWSLPCSLWAWCPGERGLGITAKCKCLVWMVHSEQGASLCWWPPGFVCSDLYSCSTLIDLLQPRWDH